jgi:hypothetical protein
MPRIPTSSGCPQGIYVDIGPYQFLLSLTFAVIRSGPIHSAGWPEEQLPTGSRPSAIGGESVTPSFARTFQG